MTAIAEQSPVEVARTIAPTIREAAEDTERERRLAPAAVEAMRAAGLFHLFVPRAYGGLEAHPVAACEAIEAVAEADGSAGWCAMIAAQCASMAGILEPAEAMRIFANRGIVAAVARPIGRATEANGEYTASGRWPFASGSSHADWFGGECVVYDGDEPRRDAGGNNISHVLFYPRSEVTLHDTWFTTGLRGTASNEFSVSGAKVPVARSFRLFVDEPKHPWALYRALPLIFVTHGAQAVGVARAAVKTGIEIAATKPGWGSDRPMRENGRVQAIIAEATVALESARHYMYATADAVWEAVVAGATDTAALAARCRLATSHATAAAVHATDLVHDAMATTAIFAKSPLERQFRDIHTAAAHVMVGPLTYEAAGRVELGLPAGMPFF